jgi:pullulanase/glycogen debranching enzyme
LSDHPRADGRREVEWRDPAGQEMTVARWHDSERRGLVVTLAPEGAETVLLLVNAEPLPQTFTLPPGRWRCVLDSSEPTLSERTIEGSRIDVPLQSVLVLRPGR